MFQPASASASISASLYLIMDRLCRQMPTVRDGGDCQHSLSNFQSARLILGPSYGPTLALQIDGSRQYADHSAYPCIDTWAHWCTSRRYSHLKDGSIGRKKLMAVERGQPMTAARSSEVALPKEATDNLFAPTHPYRYAYLT